METHDETQPDEAAVEEITETEFGEQDEAAQEAEWAEDAAEGGEPA